MPCWRSACPSRMWVALRSGSDSVSLVVSIVVQTAAEAARSAAARRNKAERAKVSLWVRMVLRVSKGGACLESQQVGPLDASRGAHLGPRRDDTDRQVRNRRCQGFHTVERCADVGRAPKIGGRIISWLPPGLPR